MLENSQAENTRLKVELKALDSLLESAKFQLASTAVKVIISSRFDVVPSIILLRQQMT
jgi:hypothetical protein